MFANHPNILDRLAVNVDSFFHAERRIEERAIKKPEPRIPAFESKGEKF